MANNTVLRGGYFCPSPFETPQRSWLQDKLKNTILLQKKKKIIIIISYPSVLNLNDCYLCD